MKHNIMGDKKTDSKHTLNNKKLMLKLNSLKLFDKSNLI